MPDFLPRRTGQLLQWSANFDRLINLDPQRFGISPLDAEAYAQLHAAFAAAYRAAIDPATRSSSNILAKDEAEAELKRKARAIAGQVRGRVESDPSGLQALGLRVRGRRRRHIAPPADAPVLVADWPRGHALPVRLMDASSLRRGRPADVSGAALFTFVGDDPPPPGEPGWRFATNLSRVRLTIDFPSRHPPGTTVWITARWFNPRGELGPWARPSSAILGAASPVIPGARATPTRVAA